MLTPIFQHHTIFFEILQKSASIHPYESALLQSVYYLFFSLLYRFSDSISIFMLVQVKYKVKRAIIKCVVFAAAVQSRPTMHVDLVIFR